MTTFEILPIPLQIMEQEDGLLSVELVDLHCHCLSASGTLSLNQGRQYLNNLTEKLVTIYRDGIMSTKAQQPASVRRSEGSLYINSVLGN